MPAPSPEAPPENRPHQSLIIGYRPRISKVIPARGSAQQFNGPTSLVDWSTNTVELLDR